MSTIAKTNKARSENKLRLYAPSWIDRFTAFIDRLPGPTWLYYIGFGLLLLLGQAAALWGEGAYPIGTVPPIQLFFALVIPFFLLLFHAFDKLAGKALASLRPTLTVSEEEYDELRYRVITLPPVPTLLVALGIVLITILIDALLGNPVSIGTSVPAPISEALVYVIYKINWWIFGTLIYHIVHQLRLINRILTKHTRINLLRITPLYAFSRLTALAAVGLIVPTYIFLALNPSFFQAPDPITLAQVSLILILAVAVFVWPLLGTRRLLAEEKERMLDEANQRFEATVVELHRRVDEGEIEGMADLNMAITALGVEQKALEKIPTWPWQPETARWLITALVLPMILWIIQFVLQRVMGP